MESVWKDIFILYFYVVLGHDLGMTNAILFMRCSTKEQGTKWSLQRQQDALRAYCERNDIAVIAEYREIASGGLSIGQRPQLQDALEHAAKESAVILVLDVSRLSRDVEIIAGFINRGVKFQLMDAPDAGAFEIQLRAVFAEEYRRKLRNRVKHGLQTAKRHGKQLGSPTLDRDRPKAWAANRAKADTFALSIAPIVSEIRAAGITSTASICQALNARGVTTSRGGAWHTRTVNRLLKRIESVSA